MATASGVLTGLVGSLLYAVVDDIRHNVCDKDDEHLCYRCRKSVRNQDGLQQQQTYMGHQVNSGFAIKNASPKPLAKPKQVGVEAPT